jgi:hypothetical protein
MDNPFSWDYLTTVPGENEVFGPFAIIFLIVFGLGFLISIAVYSGGARGVIPDPVLRRMARQWSGWAIAVFGVGLFFFAIRVLQINPLSFGMRLWLWLSWLLLLGFGCFIAWYVMRNYGVAKEAYEEHRRKQQYLRPAAAGAGAVRTTGTGSPLTAGPRSVKRKRR